MKTLNEKGFAILSPQCEIHCDSVPVVLQCHVQTRKYKYLTMALVVADAIRASNFSWLRFSRVGRSFHVTSYLVQQTFFLQVSALSAPRHVSTAGLPQTGAGNSHNLFRMSSTGQALVPWRRWRLDDRDTALTSPQK